MVQYITYIFKKSFKQAIEDNHKELLTISYAVTIFFKTSGTIPWSSIVGYWSLRFITTKGVLSGPTKCIDTAKMHCIRFATGERPHNSLNETTAFCKKERKSFLYSYIWNLKSCYSRVKYFTVILELQFWATITIAFPWRSGGFQKQLYIIFQITHTFHKIVKNSSNSVHTTEKKIYLEQVYLLSILAKINYGNKQILKHSGVIYFEKF